VTVAITKQIGPDWTEQLDHYSNLINRISKLLFQFVRKNPSESNKQIFRGWYAWTQRYNDFARGLIQQDRPVLSSEQLEMLESYRKELAGYTDRFDGMGVFGEEEITVPERVEPPKEKESSFTRMIKGGLIVAGIFGVAAALRSAADLFRGKEREE